MILYVSNEYYGEGIPIPFPATAEEVRKKLDAGVQPLFIRGNGPVWHFEDRLDPAALYQETGVEKLNRLAGLVDAMDLDAQKVFAGALRAESVNGLDDILDIASNLSRYEFIEGVTSDKELGGWLVEHGQAGVDFPKEVWPYLDYAGIGAAYYAGHGGAYTPNGYVKRREVVQTQKETGPLSPSPWLPPLASSALISPPRMMRWSRQKGRWGVTWATRPSGMWRSVTPGRTCCPGTLSPWRTPTSWPSASEG